MTSSQRRPLSYWFFPALASFVFGLLSRDVMFALGVSSWWGISIFSTSLFVCWYGLELVECQLLELRPRGWWFMLVAAVLWTLGECVSPSGTPPRSYLVDGMLLEALLSGMVKTAVSINDLARRRSSLGSRCRSPHTVREVLPDETLPQRGEQDLESQYDRRRAALMAAGFRDVNNMGSGSGIRG